MLAALARDSTALARSTRSWWAGRCYVIGNLECPLTASEQPVAKQFAFRAEPRWAGWLHRLGFTHVSLANTPHLSGLNKELREQIETMRRITQQELRHEKVSEADIMVLSQIGGWAEQLTFNILKTDRLPERERHLGVTADVYAYNGQLLEEDVGAVDALYTVVDINGTTVVAVGLVFSYYEFQSPSPLTDEEWQAKLNTSPPARPTWLRELIVPIAKVNTREVNGLY